ncbi:hypothetical protein ACQP3F_34455, partial [Escherichia coli]
YNYNLPKPICLDTRIQSNNNSHDTISPVERNSPTTADPAFMNMKNVLKEEMNDSLKEIHETQ